MTRKEKIKEIDANFQAEFALLKAQKEKSVSDFLMKIAELKAQKEKSVSDYLMKIAELKCEAAKAKSAATYDNPDETPEKPTVWLDGSHHSAVIVARRLLRKLPRLNYKQESFVISLFPSFHGGYGLEIKYINTIDNAKGYTSCNLNAAKDSPDVQAEKTELWLSEVDNQMKTAEKIMGKEDGNE